MTAYAIVLACGALALTATSLIEAISMWGPLVMICLYMALVTVWVMGSEGHEAQAHAPYKKAV